ncbi:AIR carboxylase family protein [Candidatus Woesearchaeota archaeon]|nr:AIR carboxylase family protein [Candidatus Woesearchaeota archaeon]
MFGGSCVETGALASKKESGSNIGYVLIMAGSGSDKEHVKKITDSLDTYEIPYSVRICSAHKQPAKLVGLILQYNSDRNLVVAVAVASGTDGLSGSLSYNALFPVISCPPDAIDGRHNESCLNNPPGSSNAYIARPENVGKFIAQMYTRENSGVREMLDRRNSEKVRSLEKADLEAMAGGVK